MNNKTTPKDFFLHLGATVALYAAVIAFINLAFAVINYWFPDALAYGYSSNSIAWPISMLVILIPILYLIEWLLARDLRLMPEKKDLWIRRWRIYLTLFLAAILVVGDLVALLNTYFSGEITARFAWKGLVILVVTVAIGKYYFFSLYENLRRAKLARTLNAWAGIVLVVAAIVCGFSVVGSPAHQRALRFDNQRQSDLSNIQWQVISYWQRTEKLPAKLSDTTDSIQGNMIPMDPETDQSYEYKATGDKSFEICATFSRPSQDTKGRGAFGGTGGSIAYPMRDVGMGFDDNWKHDAGRTCFAKTIDPAIYPPTTPKAAY